MIRSELGRAVQLWWTALVWAALLLTSFPALAWEREPLAVFHERRVRLVRETGGDGLVVLFAYREQDLGVATTPFRQNENFYYLTGWNEPDAMLLLVPKVAKNGNGNQMVGLDKEILFIPAHDYRQEKWTGPKLGPDDADASARTGFPTVRSTGLFQAELQEALKTFARIYTELTPQPESGEECFVLDILSRLKEIAPLANLAAPDAQQLAHIAQPQTQCLQPTPLLLSLHASSLCLA